MHASAIESWRQLRPVLARLKSVAGFSAPLSGHELADALSLHPRQPTEQVGSSLLWRDARMGHITGSFDLVLATRSPYLHVSLNWDLVSSEEQVRNALVFGVTERRRSRSGRGWWIDHPSGSSPRSLHLALVFDEATRKRSGLRFAGAIYT